MVGPFPTGSLDEVVCANGEHMERLSWRGKGAGVMREKAEGVLKRKEEGVVEKEG